MFRNMEYIYAVYKAGSFSEAAKELYVTQPCLSAMVKKTENQLGVPIFDRNVKPLRLTEYGVQYIAYLEKIQSIEGEFEQYLSDVRGLRTGSLSIGANTVLASFVLPSLIQKFKTRYPGVQVQLVEGSVDYLEDALIHGRLDLILDNCLLDSSIYLQYPLGAEHILIAAHRDIHDAERWQGFCLSHDDILAGRHIKMDTPALSINVFADIPVIALRTSTDTRRRMDTIYQQAGFHGDIQLEVDQLTTAYNIACTGLGMTLVSDTLLYQMPASPDMCYYKLHSDVTARTIYMSHKRSRYVPLAMQKFMDTAIAVLADDIAGNFR